MTRLLSDDAITYYIIKLVHLVSRLIMQGIIEMETVNKQKEGVKRTSEKKLSIMLGKLNTKLSTAFNDYLAFTQ